MNVEIQDPHSKDNLTFLEQELDTVNRKSKRLLTPLMILLSTAILIFIYSMLFWSSSVAFELDDMQFSVQGPIFMGLMSVLLFLEWFCYWISQKKLYSVLLAWIHVVVTCGICIGFMTTNRSFFKFQEIDSVQASIIQSLLNGESRLISFGSRTSLVFLAAQALFLFNWGSGNYEKKKMGQQDIIS